MFICKDISDKRVPSSYTFKFTPYRKQCLIAQLGEALRCACIMRFGKDPGSSPGEATLYFFSFGFGIDKQTSITVKRFA